VTPIVDKTDGNAKNLSDLTAGVMGSQLHGSHTTMSWIDRWTSMASRHYQWFWPDQTVQADETTLRWRRSVRLGSVSKMYPAMHWIKVEQQ
jgi:hypothetical protein